MKKIFFLLSLLFSLATTAQIKFEVKFSRPFAVSEFIRNASGNRGPNAFIKAFKGSEFDNEKYNSLIKRFVSIYTGYEQQFRDYPVFTKMGAETGSILNQNLILAENLDDFKMRSIGLIPVGDLNELASIIKEFTPVYDTLIYEPNKTTFEKQVRDIEQLLVTKNISGYFNQAKQFYNAALDNSIPIIFSFYPLPGSAGFMASQFNNFAVSGIPSGLTNYNAVLSVLLHELSHFLYDSETLSFKKEMDSWFTSNSSKYSRYANNLLNEAWATAVGNGYFSEKLSGKLNPGNWYNNKYISAMGKQMYPVIKEYIDNGKPIDKPFVDRYIKIYEDSFPTWITDLNHLMIYRAVISESTADADSLENLFGYTSVADYYHDFSNESFEKLKGKPITKMIIVSGDNKKKLKLIKEKFAELKNWQPDPKKDFTEMLFLTDKTQLIIVNLVEKTLGEQLRSYLKK